MARNYWILNITSPVVSFGRYPFILQKKYFVYHEQDSSNAEDDSVAEESLSG